MRAISASALAILAVTSVAVGPVARGEDPQPEPIDVGRIEQVEVQLVLLDLLVLDRRDRTVPGLTQQEFALRVDGHKVAIDSLDASCPLGRADDPRGGESVGEIQEGSGAGPIRIVHAFDYYHLDSATEVLDRAREGILERVRPGEEHMIVALGTTLEVETTFTSDRAALAAALDRMETNPALYAGQYDRITERRVFQRLESLIDVLERVDGPKVVVLYSGPFRRDGFDHDPEFERIAALAAKARVVLYPVDAGGLRTPQGFRYGDFGGPKTISRLAVETGGRVTYNTNDLGLALARAQRDQGCRYTIGFHDRDPRPDVERRVSVSVKRGGVRVIYPVRYVIRSDEKRRDSQQRSALMVPELFDDGGMSAEVLALRPHGPTRWDVLVVVTLPEPRGPSGAVSPGTLQGRIITATGAATREFERELEPSGGAADPGVARGRTFVEPLVLEPGHYRVSVVLTRQAHATPWAAVADLTLAPVPREGWFLAGPHLGRYRAEVDGGSTSAAQDGEPGFEPLPNGTARRGETIDALTWVCRAGTGAEPTVATVERALSGPSGSEMARLDPVQIELDGARGLRCHALVDALATDALEPGRYSVRVALRGSQSAAEVAFGLQP